MKTFRPKRSRLFQLTQQVNFLPSPLNGNNYRILIEEVLPELLENVPLAVRRRMVPARRDSSTLS